MPRPLAFVRLCAVPIAGLLLLLAGCAPRPVSLPTVPQPLAGDQCIGELDSLGATFRQVESPVAPHPCGVDDAIMLKAAPVPLAHPVLMGCELGLRVTRWQAEAVQEEAHRYLGQPVIGAIDPLIGYACRQEIGSKRNYVSQHGYGRALDIGGWRLGNGTTVSVARDWHDRGPRGRFLHAVALDACKYFSVVLTPDVNAAHRSHFHFDIGEYRYCAPTGRR
jgi:hypothetical protein